MITAINCLFANTKTNTKRQNQTFTGVNTIINIIKSELSKGKSINEIAKEYIIQPEYIHSILKKQTITKQQQIELENRKKAYIIKKLLYEGKTEKEIMQETSYSKYFIRETLKKYNLKLNSKKAENPIYQQIIKLIRQGKSIKELSKEFCISIQTIYKHLKKEPTYISPKQEKKQKIIKMYISGISIQQIAEELNMRTSGIKSILQRNNVNRQQKRQNLKKIIIKKHNSGKTNKEIAQELNISHTTIYRYLKSCNGTNSSD